MMKQFNHTSSRFFLLVNEFCKSREKRSAVIFFLELQPEAYQTDSLSFLTSSKIAKSGLKGDGKTNQMFSRSNETARGRKSQFLLQEKHKRVLANQPTGE